MPGVHRQIAGRPQGRHTATAVWLMGLAVAGLLSCDDGGDAPSAGTDAGARADGFQPPPSDIDDSGRDPLLNLDGGPRADMRTTFSEFREPCADNRDCASGYCIPFEDRLVCTRQCLQEGCPDDWGCHGVANTRPDVVFVCFPPGNRLCGTCLVDADCPNGTCHEVDGQRVCGLTCDAENLCPQGYACGDDGQCAPANGSCTCNDNNAGDERLCERANQHGACLGREVCEPGAGWVGCSAQEPAAEICNAEDDDCNGFADDILGLGEPCSTAVEVEGEQLTCTGRLVCSAEVSPQPICTAPTPSAERCNFLDDDCDGSTDEGFEQRGEVCILGVGVCQRVGVFECSADGAEVACNVAAGAPVAERCNGLDDDCDGSTDEDFVGLNGACEVGVGACRRAGALRCDAAGAQAVCSAVAGEPVDERCDGLDNDCDGTADEGFDDLFAACEIGVGACRRTGFRLCTEDGAGVTCTATAAAPGVETCNGVDDDCDGIADEGFPGVNLPCSDGVGRCLRPGVTVCSADGAAVVCSVTAGQPEAERCDGLDDDCDGRVDEDFDDLDEICTAGAGACARVGVRRCAPDGAATVCSAVPAEPRAELCNGADDDCDGLADETFPNKDAPCSVGVGLCGRTGLNRCTPAGDATACDAVAAEPAPEQCDGFDNDCDGRTDEGFAGLNTPCTEGDGACRRVGITVCAEGGAGVTCNAVAAAPTVELCNGLDDDCDGRADEGFPDVLTACTVGTGACQRNGVRVCTPDGAATACDVVAGVPADETCNAEDDDCDGIIDEGFEGLGRGCVAGLGACRTNGVQVCSADGLAVTCDAADVAGGPEACNGVDDDCDGAVDEGFVGLNTACNVGQGSCRAAGVRVCSPDGAAVVCDAVAGAPAAETCNGLDDDCDGNLDEGFAGLNTACNAGQGVCRAAGVRVCSPNGAAVVCDAVAGAPAAEICNGLDDDCDGNLDEGFANLGRACAVGVGECGRAGVNVCSPDGAAVVCDVAAGAPVAERCDARDNDCDGQVDEGFAGLNTACVVGQGACLRQGVNLCAPDGAGVACSESPGAPVAELCNGIDDDCDGRTDEAFPNRNQACEAGVGACRQVGVQVCRPDGAGTACDAVAGAPAAERCDGIDNDCDGVVDNGFPNLGVPCDAGVGECRRGGVVVCSADGGAAECDASAGPPAAEVCNYRDDDCDGAVDDGFVDAQGRYVTTAHCGACGADCAAQWDPNPAAFGVAPLCRLVGGVAQCGFVCLAGFLDADNVADNGCELALDAQAIYVSTPENGGVFAGDCGALERPCAGINLGLVRAVDVGARRVRVSDGVYDEVVDLVDGIDVLGGHHRTTWRRAPDLNVTVIGGGFIGGDVHGYGVRGIGIVAPTVLDGFIIRSASPITQGNSYGVYLRDSGAALTVSNNRIEPGDGGRGVAGASGGSGPPGTPGAQGRASFAVSSVNNCGSAGGAAGAQTCGAVSVNGGTGGAQVACPVIETQAGTGGNGATARGGLGGAGAFHALGDQAGRCLVSTGGPLDASPGIAGLSGIDGGGGVGAGASDGTGGAHWSGLPGVAGASGLPGGGGGGGGAAAGVDVAYRAGDHYDIGATGGGGGSGGCNGNAGQRGLAGGGSFAIYVHFTNGPAAVGGAPRIVGNRLARGVGGAGGDGGVGGGGGEGGLGGLGGVRGAGLNLGFCSFVGGQGGVGGRGGHGGGGGGGQGGASVDIFVSNSDGVALTYNAENVFVIGAGEATGGRGGVGGASSNTAIGLGTDGAVGRAANLIALP